MSGAMNALVVVLTVVNILAALWLIWYTRKDRVSATDAKTTGHVWDTDLREWNNPLPRWWLWLFLASIGFSVVYLALYPGLGNYAGTLGWTQGSQHLAEVQRAAIVERQILGKFAGRAPEDLSRDDQALAVGRNLYANNCSTCHGADGRGAPGFPNLTDRDWLWGGDAATIRTSIADGRTGAMVGWRDALGDQGVENVLAYVLSLSGRSVAAGDLQNGQQRFAMLCASCHGAEGKGNPQLGAPNLTDNIWLAGGSVTAVRTIIEQGRIGIMPAHTARLGDARVNLLTAYVLGLGAPPPPGD
jgi:cytochrome c oxidase cbb3-type subunit 3